MRSLLRFLGFIILLAVIIAALYAWRTISDGKRSITEASSTSPYPALEEIDKEFTTLVDRTLPSVVSITALSAEAANPRLQILRQFLGGRPGVTPPQMGSGTLVSPEGHIVTNYHVIAGAVAVEVILNDGRVLPAHFLGADGPSDIAILKIEAEGLTPISWGDSDMVRVGQMVLAVGNPLGLQETVTQGIISAKGRRAASEAANEFFQTDAAINQGNSGGPLVNRNGKLIGITNMVTLQAQGIAFAIPSNTVRRVFESIRDHGRFIRPWFGATAQSLTPQLIRQLGLQEDTGALVLLTYAGSPAEKAGLEPGDVVIEFNGRPIRDHIDLRNRVTETNIGQTATLKVRRGKQTLSIPIVIAAEPQS